MKRLAALLLALLLFALLPVPAHAAGESLAGAVIALDPGHQLGNSNPKFSSQMKQKRFNGTLVKSCNTHWHCNEQGSARGHLHLAGEPTVEETPGSARRAR